MKFYLSGLVVVKYVFDKNVEIVSNILVPKVIRNAVVTKYAINHTY